MFSRKFKEQIVAIYWGGLKPPQPPQPPGSDGPVAFTLLLFGQFPDFPLKMSLFARKMDVVMNAILDRQNSQNEFKHICASEEGGSCDECYAI